MTDLGTCRSCGAGIRWALSINGKPTPMDVSPVDDGNRVIFNGVAMTREQADERGAGPLPLFKSHFATCPNRNQHRKGNR